MTETDNHIPSDKLRHYFHQLLLDWIHLHTTLPTPLQSENARRQPIREYGHPAEWASDTKAKIVDLLTEWHTMLAEHRNETPPPTGAEQVRINAAWRYLEPRCDQLASLIEREAFTELKDLHHEVKRRLGYTNPHYNLPIPCPNDECGLRTLQRRIAVGTDLIICGSCGYTIREEHYPLFSRMMLDTLIDTASCQT